MERKPILVSPLSTAAERNPMLVFLWNLVSQSPEAPVLRLEKEDLHVGAQTLSLQGKRLVQGLVHVFLSAPLHQVHRGELVTRLYSARPSGMLSWRQRECYHHNTVKLISRTRKLLRAAFPLGTQWEWLPYDAHSQTWSLYRLRFCPTAAIS